MRFLHIEMHIPQHTFFHSQSLYLTKSLSRFFPLRDPCFNVPFSLFCLDESILYSTLLSMWYFFCSLQQYIAFRLLSFATLYFWSVQSQSFSAECREHKSGCLYTCSLCVSVIFFAFQAMDSLKYVQTIPNCSTQATNEAMWIKSMSATTAIQRHANQEKWRRTLSDNAGTFPKVFRQLWFMCVINVWDWECKKNQQFVLSTKTMPKKKKYWRQGDNDRELQAEWKAFTCSTTQLHGIAVAWETSKYYNECAQKIKRDGQKCGKQQQHCTIDIRWAKQKLLAKITHSDCNNLHAYRVLK